MSEAAASIILLDSSSYKSQLLKSKFENPETYIRNNSKIKYNYYKNNQSVAIWEKYHAPLELKLRAALMCGFVDYVNWHKREFDFTDSMYLRAACAGGNQSLISLVMCPEPICEPHRYWREALCGACEFGDINIVNLLLSKFQFPFSSCKFVPLTTAARYGHFDIVKLFCSKNCIISVTVVVEAAINNHVEILMYLLEKEPLHIERALTSACEGGHVDLIENLILMGAKNWISAFIGACRGKQIAIVKEMIARGVSVFNQGLEVACRDFNITLEASKTLASLELVELMVENGANNFDEALKMHCIKEIGCNIKILEFLISKGANNFDKAMDVACRYGNMTAVEYLVEIIGISSAISEKYIMSACTSNNFKLVHFLLKNGATVTKEVLIKACSADNNLCVIDYLLKHSDTIIAADAKTLLIMRRKRKMWHKQQKTKFAKLRIGWIANNNH